jgi:hypothetical protein
MTALLVDEGIGRDLVAALVNQGCVAYHWLQIGTKGAHDSEIFHESQIRQLTIFTLNHEDFVFASICWLNWKMGVHHGVIAPHRGPQPSPARLLQLLEWYCSDQSSFINRIELF